MVGTDESLELPEDALGSEELELLSVEEIYEILQKKNPASRPELLLADLLKAPPPCVSDTDASTDQDGLTSDGDWSTLHERQELDARR